MKATRPSPRKFYGVSSDKIPLGTPQAMLDAIENESQGIPPKDPYRARIERLMTSESEYYDVDGRADADHLRQTRGGIALEEMSRSAGFVLGFEFHEWLHAGGKTTGAK